MVFFASDRTCFLPIVVRLACFDSQIGVLVCVGILFSVFPIANTVTANCVLYVKYDQKWLIWFIKIG